VFNFKGNTRGIFVENVRLQIGRLELSNSDLGHLYKKTYNTPGGVDRQFQVACNKTACDRRREFNGK
jgi:hypothetical protein